MLVLRRKVGQTATLDVAGGITIKVLAIDAGGVRLAFSCPKEIRVKRGEAKEDKAMKNSRAENG